MQSVDDISKRIFRSFFLTADKVTHFIYKVSHGSIGHKQAGYRILLLKTTGRRTGISRTHALLYTKVNGDWVVIASNGGDHNHPAWFLNLVANPRLQIQVGKKYYQVQAQITTGTEREILWQKLLNIWPLYANYQKGTDRNFPIIILRKVD